MLCPIPAPLERNPLHALLLPPSPTKVPERSRCILAGTCAAAPARQSPCSCFCWPDSCFPWAALAQILFAGAQETLFSQSSSDSLSPIAVGLFPNVISTSRFHRSSIRRSRPTISLPPIKCWKKARRHGCLGGMIQLGRRCRDSLREAVGHADDDPEVLVPVVALEPSSIASPLFASSPVSPVTSPITSSMKQNSPASGAVRSPTRQPRG